MIEIRSHQIRSCPYNSHERYVFGVPGTSEGVALGRSTYTIGRALEAVKDTPEFIAFVQKLAAEEAAHED